MLTRPIKKTSEKPKNPSHPVSIPRPFLYTRIAYTHILTHKQHADAHTHYDTPCSNKELLTNRKTLGKNIPDTSQLLFWNTGLSSMELLCICCCHGPLERLLDGRTWTEWEQRIRNTLMFHLGGGRPVRWSFALIVWFPPPNCEENINATTWYRPNLLYWWISLRARACVCFSPSSPYTNCAALQLVVVALRNTHIHTHRVT